MKKKEQGITLIALVVTIIILIILAGISISVLLGENGLIAKAQQAKTDYLNAQNKELAEMGNAEEEIENALVKKDPVPGELELIGENTYEINSIEDLVALAYSVNIEENKYLGKTIELGRSLDFEKNSSYANPEAKYRLDTVGTGYVKDEVNGTSIKELLLGENGFIPIGSYESKGFYGIINGNNNVISNIKIKTKMTAGLVGSVYSDKLEVNDLSLEGGKIETEQAAGGIVGALFEGTLSITNCHNTAMVTAVVAAGGLLGYTGGSETIINIESCCNEGTITAVEAGGIIGWEVANCKILSVMNCKNTGEISANSRGWSMAGGIIGDLYTDEANITNCYNTGPITSTSGDTGGIIGRNVGKKVNIASCYNSGVITKKNAYYNGAGGIIGHEYMGEANIINSYNVGEIITDVNSFAGGIVGIKCVRNGVANTNITNCYNAKKITATGTDLYEGGIVGGILDANNANYKVITENTNVTVINSYYQEETAEKGIGTSTETEISGIIQKTADQMKSPEFLTEIKGTTDNTAWKREDLKNEGMPILSWQ